MIPQRWRSMPQWKKSVSTKNQRPRFLDGASSSKGEDGQTTQTWSGEDAVSLPKFCHNYGNQVKEDEMRHQGKWGMQDWPCQGRAGKTDWQSVKSLSDDHVMARAESDPDAQPTNADFWKDAKVVSPPDRLDDFKTLISKAVEAVYDALQDGIRQGKQPGEWRTQSIADHLHHGFLHNYKYRWCGAPSTEHLTHAVCRVVMAYTLHMEKK